MSAFIESLLNQILQAEATEQRKPNTMGAPLSAEVMATTDISISLPGERML